MQNSASRNIEEEDLKSKNKEFMQHERTNSADDTSQTGVPFKNQPSSLQNDANTEMTNNQLNMVDSSRLNEES